MLCSCYMYFIQYCCLMLTLQLTELLLVLSLTEFTSYAAESSRATSQAYDTAHLSTGYHNTIPVATTFRYVNVCVRYFIVLDIVYDQRLHHITLSGISDMMCFHFLRQFLHTPSQCFYTLFFCSTLITDKNILTC